MRESRTSHQLTPSRVNQNNTYSEVQLEPEAKQHYTRRKVFSINHYDIYRPGLIVNRSSALSAKKEETAKIE